MVGRPEYHVPALDGVRGVAILMVILFHCRSVFNSPAELPYVLLRVMDLGWSGVDLFFVLSGFLITGVLLDSRESPAYFRTFYLRRALRIFPLYFAYLFLVLVLFRFGWLWTAGADLWKGTNPWWYVTYLLNWKSDHGYNDLYLGHFWSLAIEEQFYCVWPLVVWLCPVKRLRWLCLGIAIASLAFRCQLGRWGVDQEAIYRMTPSRTEALVWGAMAAVGLRQFPEIVRRWSGPVFCVAAAVFFNVVVWAQQGMWHDWRMRTAGVSSLALAYACLVLWAAAPGTGIVSRVFSIPLLRRLGKISYGMYVWQSILPPHGELGPGAERFFTAMASRDSSEIPVFSGERGCGVRRRVAIVARAGGTNPPIEEPVQIQRSRGRKISPGQLAPRPNRESKRRHRHGAGSRGQRHQGLNPEAEHHEPSCHQSGAAQHRNMPQ